MLVIAITLINLYIKCLYSQNNAAQKCAISSEKEPTSCWGIYLDQQEMKKQLPSQVADSG